MLLTQIRFRNFRPHALGLVTTTAQECFNHLQNNFPRKWACLPSRIKFQSNPTRFFRA
jgi:hypothetical protein